MKMIDPTGTAETGLRPLAARPRSLAGVAIGVLDNSKPNAGVLLRRLADDLAEKWGAGPVRVWQKPGSSVAAAPAVIDDIASTCRVVLTGSARSEARRVGKEGSARMGLQSQKRTI